MNDPRYTSAVAGTSRVFTGSMPSPNISSVTAPSRGVTPSSPKMTGDTSRSPSSLSHARPKSRRIRVPFAIWSDIVRCGSTPSLPSSDPGTNVYVAPESTSASTCSNRSPLGSPISSSTRNVPKYCHLWGEMQNSISNNLVTPAKAGVQYSERRLPACGFPRTRE